MHLQRRKVRMSIWTTETNQCTWCTWVKLTRSAFLSWHYFLSVCAQWWNTVFIIWTDPAVAIWTSCSLTKCNHTFVAGLTEKTHVLSNTTWKESVWYTIKSQVRANEIDNKWHEMWTNGADAEVTKVPSNKIVFILFVRTKAVTYNVPTSFESFLQICEVS